MEKLFVIRGFHWGYNDETYYPCGSYINSTFTSEAEAKKELIALERSHWANIDLGETMEFFDGDQKLIDKVNAFVSEKCGKPLFTDDDPRDTFVPRDLSDDDFTAFLKVASLGAFKLTVFDKAPTFFAVYFPDDEEYLKIFDECTEALVFAESMALLKKEAIDELECRWDEGLSLEGEVAELSDNPVLLEALINSNEGLEYQTNEKRLTVDVENAEALFAVNELLKKPLFEVKELTIEEVKALESDMEDYY